LGRLKFNFWAFNIALAASSLYLLSHYLPGPAAGVWLNMLFFAVLIFSLALL
jgi:hypothetical protein